MKRPDLKPQSIDLPISREGAISLMAHLVSMHRKRAALAFVTGVMAVIGGSFMPDMFADGLAKQFNPTQVRRISLAVLFVLALLEFTFVLVFLWFAQRQQRELTKTLEEST